MLRTIEATCLSPVAVERIVAGAFAALTRPPEAMAAREATLRGEPAALETKIARYTAAIGQAPDLASVLDALRARERQRATLRGELDGLRRLREAEPIDRGVVERQVRAVVADWWALMGKQVAESRRLLKGLLEGRVVFTPAGRRVRHRLRRAGADGPTPARGPRYHCRWCPRRDTSGGGEGADRPGPWHRLRGLVP